MHFVNYYQYVTSYPHIHIKAQSVSINKKGLTWHSILYTEYILKYKNYAMKTVGIKIIFENNKTFNKKNHRIRD